MSINIPAETPDESTNPISVEEFERLHPAMLGAIRKAVREEPARTVIGTVGDDRRSHLSSLDLRGIGIEVGRQLSARDMTTEVMGSILERINQAADRLSTEIQELRSELIREHVETVGGGAAARPQKTAVGIRLHSTLILLLTVRPARRICGMTPILGGGRAVLLTPPGITYAKEARDGRRYDVRCAR